MKNYFHQQKESIFKDVEVLIYVFDVNKQSADLAEDLSTYKACLDNLAELS
jgi:Ras-related GTP-binding protein A/B